MLSYHQINESSFLLELTNSEPIRMTIDELSDPKRINKINMAHYDSTYDLVKNPIDPMDHIYECSLPLCIFTRTDTNIRERFEKKIIDFARNRNHIKILFFSSFMLFQELKILMMLNTHIDEIHFTDYAYHDWKNESDNKYHIAFKQFMQFIRSNRLKTSVIVHLVPDLLRTSHMWHKQFDIIAGIDIDVIISESRGHFRNRKIITDMASVALKSDGMMCVSQHFKDLVDLSHYAISKNATILKNIDMFVKPPYYKKYLLQSWLMLLIHPYVLCIHILLGTILLISNGYQSYPLYQILIIYLGIAVYSILIPNKYYSEKIYRIDEIAVSAVSNIHAPGNR